MVHTEVLLHSRRRERALLAQKIQHAAPAFVLLFDGLQSLKAHAEWLSLVVAGAEILTSVLVLGSVARSMRNNLRAAADTAVHHHHGVDWIDLFLSAMLATEALAHWYETSHIRRPTLLLAITMLALGLSHGRLSARQMRRRGLLLTDDGISVGGRFFTRFTAPWDEIARIQIDDTHATIVKTDGVERRIDLADLRNRHEVALALQQAQRRLTDGATVA
jgi:hypothetical protein